MSPLVAHCLASVRTQRTRSGRHRASDVRAGNDRRPLAPFHVVAGPKLKMGVDDAEEVDVVTRVLTQCKESLYVVMTR